MTFVSTKVDMCPFFVLSTVFFINSERVLKLNLSMKIFKASQYDKSELNEDMLDESPFKQFEKWYVEAEEAKLSLPNSMSLATASKDSIPSVRTVLLKYFDEKGFVFYTNYESRKAKEIDENPNVALLFFWNSLERQIRISGSIEKISTRDSLKYFISRPRDSQLGAWVSDQSSIITSRKLLLQKMDEMKRKFKDGKIPLPDHWGGYRVVPNSFEFWQGRTNRLHDRILYLRTDESWEIKRLAP